jgi:hypothetical protein
MKSWLSLQMDHLIFVLNQWSSVRNRSNICRKRENHNIERRSRSNSWEGTICITTSCYAKINNKCNIITVKRYNRKYEEILLTPGGLSMLSLSNNHNYDIKSVIL